MSGGAVLSPCGLYRYYLWRNLYGPAESYRYGTLLFVMLNPSKADASKNDPTIRRCLRFAREWGFGRLAVVNLAAWRDTHPRKLRDAHRDGHDLAGPENLKHLEQGLRDAHRVVYAWGSAWRGNLPRAPRSYLPAELPAGKSVCLGFSKQGDPRHPLMLRKDVSWEHWCPVADG